MAATHVVTLFLHTTIKFHDAPKDSKAPSPPTGAQVEKRNSSVLDLPSRASAPSLFHAPTTPSTPNTAAEDIFSPKPPDEFQKYHVSKPSDSRLVVQSDPEAPAWGSQAVFNQPRSRAGPLPSGSILDFAKYIEEQEQQNGHAPQRPRNLSLQGSDEAYEGKLWTVEPAIHGNGGLTNAMRAVANDGDVDVSWIGTLGFPTDAIPHETRDEINDHLMNVHHSEIVFVSDKDLDGHYNNYCKLILWPIFHYQVPDHPKSKAFLDHSWKFYWSVNEAFAAKVVKSYKRGDTVWIHDYHLLLVPRMVREKLPDAQIGFFLHTAFPSSEIFRGLPTRKKLLDGMLGANLIGFQTEEYAQHFLQTCSRLLTVETTGEGVQLEDHFVNVVWQPIGINPVAFQEAREANDVKEWITTMQERYKNKLLIVARDKLDNVHGVRQKLLAWELFLNQNPEWAEKAVLIQVATSTSEQAELLTTVSDICTRIDRDHSSLVHQPLVFLKQDIDFAQYLALLSVADVFVNTALRDGMNLAIHDTILCQDGTSGGKKHAPIILSEFTGSAALFQGQISVNPWDYKQQADAMKQALEMDEQEKEHRWRLLYDIVLRQTGTYWVNELSKSLAKVHEEHNQRASTAVPRLSTTQVGEKYKRTSNRVFIIDYEGTLAPHKTSTGIPLAQPHRIVETLNDLMTDSKNTVYIMSGRQPQELEGVFRTATGLGLIAENGCFVRDYAAPLSDWQTSLDLEAVKQWKSAVKSILKYWTERFEGSYVEERYCSVLFRYEKVEDQETATRQAGECADQINSGCKSMSIQAVPIIKAVLVESTEISKKTASQQVFEALRSKSQAEGLEQPDFLVVVGDDREDEVVFRWANALEKQGTIRDVFTVSVGKRNTEAQAALTQGSTGLLTLLQKLAKISLDEMPADYFTSPRKRGR